MKTGSVLEQVRKGAGAGDEKKTSGGRDKDTNKEAVPPMTHASFVSEDAEYDSGTPMPKTLS
eukprot:3180152-Ditylum_brightwellii.AAC.1